MSAVWGVEQTRLLPLPLPPVESVFYLPSPSHRAVWRPGQHWVGKAWKTQLLRSGLSHQGVEAVGSHSCNMTSKRSTGRTEPDCGFCKTFSRPVHKGLHQLCEGERKASRATAPDSGQSEPHKVRVARGWPQTATEGASWKANTIWGLKPDLWRGFWEAASHGESQHVPYEPLGPSSNCSRSASPSWTELTAAECSPSYPWGPDREKCFETDLFPGHNWLRPLKLEDENPVC